MREVGDILYAIRSDKGLYDKQAIFKFLKLEVIKANKSSYYAVEECGDIKYRFKQSNDAYVDKVSSFGYSSKYRILSSDKEEAKKDYDKIVYNRRQRDAIISYISQSVHKIHGLNLETLIVIAKELGATEEDLEVKEEEME